MPGWRGIAARVVDNPVGTVDKLRDPLGVSNGEKSKRRALGIFAKAPVPGQVKTRLSPPLTPEEAAALYRLCLEETVEALSGGPWDLILFYAGEADFFRQAFPALPLRPQTGAGLGERMAGALAGLLAEGYGAAALVGSDTPDLPLSLVEEAFDRLGGAEVVVAPSDDGGYVLIGESRHHPPLFRDIPWSTPAVLPLTRRRAEDLAIPYAEAPPWEDLDDHASLLRLIKRSPKSPTAALARQLLETTPHR